MPTEKETMKQPPQPERPETYVEGIIEGVVVRPLVVRADKRGWLAELYRSDELPAEQHPVMAYLSETLPGVARGPHEHRDQTDCFAFIGPGDFSLYLWDARVGSPTRGTCMKLTAGESSPQIAIIPPGVVHGYRNTGKTPGWVFNAANRLYAGQGRREAVDEIRYEDSENHPYRMD